VDGLNYFVIVRYHIKIMAWRPAILIDVFDGFPNSLQVNAGQYSKLGNEYSLANLLQSLFTDYPSILYYIV
jgi:hypothetical protein